MILSKAQKLIAAAFSVRVFSGASIVFSSFLTAEIIGITAFGKFVIVLVFCDLIIAFCKLGLPTFYLREFSKDGHNSKLAGLFTISIPITFVLSLSASLLFSNFIPEDLKLATSFMVIYSFSSILIEILSARLRASGEFLNIVTSETIFKNGLIFIGLIILYNTSNVLVDRKSVV